MNLLLIRGGDPPVAVRPTDRAAYLETLEHGSLAANTAPFQIFMHQRPAATLEDYLMAVREAIPGPAETP